MTYETIRYEVIDRVLTVTLNRPDQLNAFTVRMADELVHAFRAASDDDGVGAIVVTGEGRAFCAGMDLDQETGGNVFGLNERLSPTLADMNRLNDPQIVSGVRDTGGRVTLAIYDCKKPVIAAINGAAVGIGVTMTLAMDIRIASDQARFGFVFEKLGIVPEACSTWFLPRVVGLSQALEWVYAANVFDATEALRGRLIRSIVPAAELASEAQKLARMLASNRSPVSTALTRQMMYRNSAQPHPVDAHKIESLSMFYVSKADGKEGVTSFREKRTPAFTSLASQMPDFYPWWN